MNVVGQPLTSSNSRSQRERTRPEKLEDVLREMKATWAREMHVGMSLRYGSQNLPL